MVVNSYGNKEQLITVPRLENSSERDQGFNDYRELNEFSVIFLGGEKNRKFKARPGGIIH